MTASFAGSMKYLCYRFVMRIIWRRLPLPPKDHEESCESTNWEAVARFTTEFLDEARQKQASPVQA